MKFMGSQKSTTNEMNCEFTLSLDLFEWIHKLLLFMSYFGRRNLLYLNKKSSVENTSEANAV